MVFILINIVLLIAIIVLLILLSWIWPPDSPWSPWWKTNKAVSRNICKLARIGKKDIFYELGSGNGTTLIIAIREFGVKKAVGIEIDPLRHYLSRYYAWYNKVTQSLTLYKKSFFDIKIADATVVYVYLVPKALKKLQRKFLKELQPGTRIVSWIYPIDYLPLSREDKQKKIYVYTIPPKKDTLNHK